MTERIFTDSLRVHSVDSFRQQQRFFVFFLQQKSNPPPDQFIKPNLDTFPKFYKKINDTEDKRISLQAYISQQKIGKFRVLYFLKIRNNKLSLGSDIPLILLKSHISKFDRIRWATTLKEQNWKNKNEKLDIAARGHCRRFLFSLPCCTVVKRCVRSR